MSDRRVLIIGAGIGGLSAGVTLASRGWSVDIAEAQAVNGTVGVGLNHPANALRALRELGLFDQVAERGWQYRGIRRYDQQGSLIALFEPVNPPDVPFQISMTRADLHEILTTAAEKAGATIRLGTSWTGIEQHDDGVDVTFNNGSTETYELVVAADGIRSAMRRELFGADIVPVDTGYACWRMSVPKPPELTHSEYWNGDTTKATVIHLSADQMYLFLVEKVVVGSAPDRSSYADELRRRLAGFGGLIGEIRDNIGPATEIHWAPLQEVFLPAPWYRGRVLLIGDAAHAVAPHLAQGAGMAMEDALVLADELGRTDSVPAALAAFMDRRFERVKFVQDHAHAILMNEMESDGEKKAEFARNLGSRQEHITSVLATPA